MANAKSDARVEVVGVFKTRSVHVCFFPLTLVIILFGVITFGVILVE